MNNDDEKKENGSSLFADFENAVGGVTNKFKDGQNIDESEQEELEQQNSSNYNNDFDENFRRRKNSKDELNEDNANLQNKRTPDQLNNKELSPDNPSNPNQLNRNKPNNIGRNSANNIGEKVGEKAGEEVGKKAGEQVGKEALKTGAKSLGTNVGAAGSTAGTGAAAGAGATTAGTGAAAAGTGAAAGAGATAAGAGGALVSNPIGWVILIIIGIALILLVLLIIIMFIILLSQNNMDLSDNTGYQIINNYCDSVTVTSGDNPGTYEFEEYVAGVVQAETAIFNNPEVYKTFSIAARNYFYNRNVNCSIKGDSSAQAFVIPTNNVVISAVKETSGLIFVMNGDILNTMYDAFALKSVDDNYYTLKQKDQKIPVSWVKNNSYLYNNLEWYADRNHGKGMSQWGAKYLAETGYTYEQILKYYYGETGKIAKIADALFFSGENIASTDGSSELHEPLASYLNAKGSNVNSLNQTIYSNVRNAGVGTRAGVVKAASTLIGTLKQNYNIHLPYTYSGGHNNGIMGNSYVNGSTYGVDGLWGSKFNGGFYYGDFGPYYYYGPDCSAFIAWAIYNGGFKNTMSSASDYKSIGKTCNANNNSCKGQAGDLIHTPGHIVLIIGVSNNNYVIAEASGKEHGMRIRTASIKSNMTIVKMDDFYNNANNQRIANYPQV